METPVDLTEVHHGAVQQVPTLLRLGDGSRHHLSRVLCCLPGPSTTVRGWREDVVQTPEHDLASEDPACLLKVTHGSGAQAGHSTSPRMMPLGLLRMKSRMRPCWTGSGSVCSAWRVPLRTKRR